MQTANFLATGALTIAGGLGIHRTLREKSAASSAPVLVTAIGAGIFAAGVFPTDTAAETRSGGLTSRGVAHVAAAVPVFTGMPLACLSIARYSRATGATRRSKVFTSLALVSALSATLMGVGFGGENAVSRRAGTIQRVAVICGLGGVSLFCLQLCRGYVT